VTRANVAAKTAKVAAKAAVHHVRALLVQAVHAQATARSLPSRVCAAKVARVAHVQHVTASAVHVQPVRGRVAVHAHHAKVRAVHVRHARVRVDHVQHVTASVAHVQQVQAQVDHVQPVPVQVDHVQQAQEPPQLHV